MATLTPRPRLPITKGRLAQSLGLIAYQQAQEDALPVPGIEQLSNAYNTAKSAISAVGSAQGALNTLGAIGGAALGVATQVADITQALTSYKPLGAVFGFDVTQSRANKTRRGINSSMEGFATIPGPITTTIKLERAVLYESDAMQAFNFTPGNIAFQTRPICIIEIVSKPGQEDNAMEALSGGTNIMGILSSIVDIASMPVYIGCWFSESMISYKLESKQLVVQDATLSVARISPTAAVALSKFAPEGAEQILIQNLPMVGNVNTAIGKVKGLF